MRTNVTEFPAVTGESGAGSQELVTPITGPANFILIRGGRDFACDDIVRAADEWRLTRGVFNALIFSTVAFFGALALIELVLHCDEVFK